MQLAARMVLELLVGQYAAASCAIGKYPGGVAVYMAAAPLWFLLWLVGPGGLGFSIETDAGNC